MTLLQNTVNTVLSELATCLCAAVEAGGLPELCSCGVVPGQFVIPDGCEDPGCGVAWVRLDSAYPANGVGLPNGTVQNCNSMLGFDVEMGVLRCVQVMEADGSSPSPEVLAESTALQIADMYAMRQAIACCSGSKSWIVGTYTPLGPDGGMVGGTFGIQMGEV